MQNFEIIEEGEVTILKIYHSFEKDFVFYLEGNELHILKLSDKKCAKIANRILNVNGKEIPFFVKIIELKNNKTFLSVPFLIVGDHNYLKLFLGEQISMYNTQIDKLREKYRYLKENDYLERKDLFKNEYGVSDISDNNFMEFLFRKLPHLKFDFKFTYFKEFNLVRVEELIYRFNKKDFSKEVKEELLHEYFQEIKSKFESLAKTYSTKQLISVKQTGFYMGLTEPQLKKLHQQLIDDNFIKCTDTDFINAFSGRQIINKLEWIDKAERVKYVTIQTLFQLLHSCNIELSDKNRVIKKEVKEALNSIFSNSWGNITSKFNEFNPLKTNRQKTISSMIHNLKS